MNFFALWHASYIVAISLPDSNKLMNKKDFTRPICPDCEEVMEDGENDDTFYCGCCDELVPCKNGLGQRSPTPARLQWRLFPIISDTLVRRESLEGDW